MDKILGSQAPPFGYGLGYFSNRDSVLNGDVIDFKIAHSQFVFGGDGFSNADGVVIQSDRVACSQIGEGYGPWAGEVEHRTSGVLVSDRSGTSNAFGLFNLQDRSSLLIGSGVAVYEGMIVGENSRPGDMDVNPTKEKKLTNIRTHSHDDALRLTPPPPMTLESAIEFIAADELVEVTPTSIRLRKRLLSVHDRRRERGRDEDLRRAKDRETAEAR